MDSLSQSWTNPMHLLWAYGSLILSQSCLPLVCLWDYKFVSAPKFMNGYLRTCSCDVFPQSRSLSDAKIFVSDLFLYSGNSIPRSLTDDHLVWIWCSLSFLLPATLKIVANSLSMFYRCLRFRLLIGIDILFDYCCYQNGDSDYLYLNLMIDLGKGLSKEGNFVKNLPSLNKHRYIWSQHFSSKQISNIIMPSLCSLVDLKKRSAVKR